jgi:hypothetical protein
VKTSWMKVVFELIDPMLRCLGGEDDLVGEKVVLIL